MRFVSILKTRSDDDTLQQDVVRFHKVARVLQECDAHIRDLANDRSRTQFEIESEIAFWREQVDKWRARLPLTTSDSSDDKSWLLMCCQNKLIAFLQS